MIFDEEAVRAAIAKRLSGGADGPAVRRVTVEVLKAAISTGRSTIEEAFEQAPLAARPAVVSYSYLTDGVVRTALHVAQTYLHPNPNPTEGERIAVMAVGGYGRGEMAPFSDVDLLFLNPWKITPWAESLIESMLYICWDLHLKVGHSSRTVKDCIRLGKDDYTIRTALLEHRFLAGDPGIAKELADKLKSELFKKTASEFIEAKLAERAERHRKQGGQRYLVEPNVKEAKGGLRDLQTLYWIGKYIHGVNKAAELVNVGLLRQDEYDDFVSAETFLMAIRNHLHIAAGRAMDTLTFDMQVEVARRMGYVDKAGRRGVEVFMQDYFRHATTVGELTRIFLTALEAKHVKQAPSLVSLFRRRRKVGDQYTIKQNRLNVTRLKPFLADNLNLLRIFDEALRTGYLLH
ncbi:MAG: [protein-PII] uridylyltransferase, partial [Boseongicola sp.]|nr:[protein-PII] uridylyltransferase [Boseongicola sp.]